MTTTDGAKVNQHGQAVLSETKNLNYKGGYVQCACGWRKELGDGFNGYYILACLACNPAISTRSQGRVTVGRPGNYTIRHGHFVYFVIADCIHVQYSGTTYHEEHRQRLPR
jgi:hypothetical protein